MINYNSQYQTKITEFNNLYSLELNPSNRWIQLGFLLPWDKLVKIYSSKFSEKNGTPSVNPRWIIGNLIIKHILNLSDQETLQTISENPYMQFFLDCNNFSPDLLFSPTVFVDIRKRLGNKIFYQFFIDAHIDLIGIMFFVFTIYFYENKKILAAIFLGASLAVKPTFLLVLPILFFYDKEFKDKIKWIIIPILFLIISFLPFLIGANPFISLLNFSRHWNFNGAAFNLFSIFIHNTLTLRILLLSVFTIIYLSIILFNKNLNSRIYYSLFALFIFSPIVHPWYVTWLIVPLVLKPKLSGITYISLISITFYSVLNYQINGEWKEYTSILFIEYIPVIIILFFEIALKFKQIQIRNS